MDWSSKIFSYCERGLDPGFWAEPLNAISNAAFLIAASVAMVEWARTGRQRNGANELAMIVLVDVIGIGSFLFHTFATRWAVLADVLPITAFMIAYLAYALMRYVRLGWLATTVLVGLFIATLAAADSLKCGTEACLNGSVGYLPAFAVLALIGGWLTTTGGAAGPPMLAGAGVFLVSLTLRTLDRQVCPATTIAGVRLGTHFIWHICNATLLYILLRVAIRYGKPSTGR